MGDTYTNAAWVGGLADCACSAAGMEKEKQAATSVAARFLYMVFLDMASMNENARQGSTGGRRNCRHFKSAGRLPLSARASSGKIQGRWRWGCVAALVEP